MNGGRDLAAIVHHMREDAAVLWAWNPGGTRTPVSMAHDVFMRHVEGWAAANGPCPE
ncbi:MAG: hypothetical protein ACRCWO_07555 [Bosea sp. (in: a-proteobacteria)]